MSLVIRSLKFHSTAGERGHYMNTDTSIHHKRPRIRGGGNKIANLMKFDCTHKFHMSWHTMVLALTTDEAIWFFSIIMKPHRRKISAKRYHYIMKNLFYDSGRGFKRTETTKIFLPDFVDPIYCSISFKKAWEYWFDGLTVGQSIELIKRVMSRLICTPEIFKRTKKNVKRT